MLLRTLRPRRQGDRPHPKLLSSGVPIVDELRLMAVASPYTLTQITEVAGVTENFFRSPYIPKLDRLIAVGEVLGYELKWVKK